MALADSLQAFVTEHPEIGDVFYVTLPPPVLLQIFSGRRLRLAHLCARHSTRKCSSGRRRLSTKCRRARRLQPSERVCPQQRPGSADRSREPRRASRSAADLSGAKTCACSFPIPKRGGREFRSLYASAGGSVSRRRLELRRHCVIGWSAAATTLCMVEHVHHREAPASVANGQRRRRDRVSALGTTLLPGVSRAVRNDRTERDRIPECGDHQTGE